jgi:hypothetical protein
MARYLDKSDQATPSQAELARRPAVQPYMLLWNIASFTAFLIILILR